MSSSVLIVDDETLFAKAVAARLEREGYACSVAGSLAEARAVGTDMVELVLLDIHLPDGSGLDFLAEIEGPPVIMITAFGDIDSAVKAMKDGAADYLRKPVDLDELVVVTKRVLAARRLETRLVYSRERGTRRRGEGELVGKSPMIGAVRREIAAFAEVIGSADNGAPPVLILGETGTGKTLAASLIHESHSTSEQPIVHVDCGGLSRGSAPELFGDENAPGLIEAAENGTVLLDEVSTLTPQAQAALLSIIERRRLRRPGGRRETPISASFIATSNRDLPKLVNDGEFRQDLYYRLNVLTLHMPPLRECGDDAVLLARRFIRQAANRYGREAPKLTDSGAAALIRYSWPGNARELSHVIERAVLLDDDGAIRESDLPHTTSAPVSEASDMPDTPTIPAHDETLQSMEQRLMAEALTASGGNVSAAARRLGVTRMAMRYRMNKYGL